MRWPWARAAVDAAETRAALAERMLQDTRDRYASLETRYHDLVARMLEPKAQPLAFIEPAPADVESRVRSELSQASQARLADHLFMEAAKQGIPLTAEEAREHAASMCELAEMIDTPPL